MGNQTQPLTNHSIHAIQTIPVFRFCLWSDEFFFLVRIPEALDLEKAGCRTCSQEKKKVEALIVSFLNIYSAL